MNQTSTSDRLPLSWRSKSNPQPNYLPSSQRLSNQKTRFVSEAGTSSCAESGGIWNSFRGVLFVSPLLRPLYKARQRQRRRKKKAPSILYAVYPTHFSIPRAHQNRIRAALRRWCEDGPPGMAQLVAVPLPLTGDWCPECLLRSTRGWCRERTPGPSKGRPINIFSFYKYRKWYIFYKTVILIIKMWCWENVHISINKYSYTPKLIFISHKVVSI
jgi:hypothetical protein